MSDYAKKNIAKLEEEYRSGIMSVNQLAQKYKMAEPTLRYWAKNKGWIRFDGALKRSVVNAGVNGAEIPPPEEIDFDDPAIKALYDAARDDIADMNMGLVNARLALQRTTVLLQDVRTPLQLKTLSECNRINIDTIRRIRQMDDPNDGRSKTVESVLDLIDERRDGLPGED